MPSIWTEKQKNNKTKKLPVKTDVLIIGGGMVGILCAQRLRNEGVSCVIVEADRLCAGTTGNTTAKITSQHGLIYASILKRYGAEKAALYLKANEVAIAEYRRMCQNIECDFEEKSAFVYSIDNRRKLENELDALGKIGNVGIFSEKIPLPFPVSGAIEFKNQAQFNPVRFALAVADELYVTEHTKVMEINGHDVRTNKGHIYADKIIVATHFPFINKHGSYFLKLYQDRSYVVAFENAPDYNGMYVDESNKGLSFRNYKNLLLLGGEGHRTGKKSEGWDVLSNFARVHYPHSVEHCRWAAQDCMSLDRIPYIGKYSKRTENMYVAAGFNKWGMTGAMAAAMLLADLIIGKENEFAELFSPSRSILHPQLAINVFDTITDMVIPTTRRCPHLGCALRWNKYEHSWDCPCHGSRFDEDGRLINNPATGDMKQK